jgi:CubicO group peptidase (beta-lactamase class C family)
LGDVFTEAFSADPNRYRSIEDFLPLFVDQPLQFTPGQEFSYSNAGYVVLGLLIEKVSGQSYDDYVRLNIFEPSGMADTRAYDIDEVVPNLAIGYTTVDFYGNETGVLASNTALMPGRGFPAGGGYSTVEDLFRFRNALLGYRLLTQPSTELLIAGQVEVRENVQYAHGFFDRIEAGGRMVGHTGGAPGVCSFLSMYLDSGYTVVVLSNSDLDCAAVLTFLRENPLR